MPERKNRMIGRIRLAAVLGALALTLLLGAATASAASYPTVYKGVDYSKIYNYYYYVNHYADVKAKYGGNKKAVLRNFALHGLHHGRAGNSYCKTAAGKKRCREMIYKTMMTASDAKISKALYKTKTAKLTKQIILVVGHTIFFWQKSGYGVWEMKLKAYCGYGRNGLSYDRTAGDGTTPIGSFPIVYAFGNAKNPGTKMKYRPITPNSYLSIERPTYNQWVESSSYVSGEHLSSYSVYKYAMWIGYNTTNTVYGKGSAIFLHLKGKDWSTAGCVSVREPVMLQILKLAKNGTRMIIVPTRAKIANY